jgi:hypothetical protein
MKQVLSKLVLLVACSVGLYAQDIGYSFKQPIQSPYGIAFYDNIEGTITDEVKKAVQKLDGSMLITESDTSDGPMRGYIFIDNYVDMSTAFYVDTKKKTAYFILTNQTGAVYGGAEVLDFTITDSVITATLKAEATGAIMYAKWALKKKK